MGWEGAGPYALCYYDSIKNGSKIKVPTLLIYGTASKLLNVGEEIHKNLINSQLVTLETKKERAQGMFTHDQDPARWMHAITKFLDNK